MIFLFVSILMQQLLPLSLHTASYLLLLLSPNFCNHFWKFLTSSSSGLYNFWYSFYFLLQIIIFHCLVYFTLPFINFIFMSFEHFVFLLQNCQIIWGWVCVMIFYSHMTYSHLPSNFLNYGQLKLNQDTIFGFLVLGSKYPYNLNQHIASPV